MTSGRPDPADSDAAGYRDIVIGVELPRIIDDVVASPEIATGLERSGLTAEELHRLLSNASDLLVQPADHLLPEQASLADSALIDPVARARWSWLVLSAGTAGLAAVLVLTDGVLWPALYLALFVLATIMTVQRMVRSRLSTPDWDAGEWRRVCAEDGVLPYARRIINERLAPGLRSSVTVTPGLVGERGTSYAVRTASVRHFAQTLRQLPAGAIGVAGPRGAGKTTLITMFAEHGDQYPGPLRVTVSAPVRYDPREFILHLFATLCREVIRKQGPPVANRMYGLLRGTRRVARLVVFATAAVLSALPVTGPDLFDHWEPALIPAALLGTAFVVDLVVALWQAAARRLRRLTGNEPVEERAKRHLDEIHNVRVQLSGWAGKVPLPLVSEAGWSRSVQRERRAHTYPELVTALRDFLAAYAAGNPRTPAAIIAVDELDKIESAERAQEFINEIKSVFGAPGTQFLVSVSEDALAAFERRGLPVRDAFDSAFDEIVRVGHLSLADTAELVKSRVIGLPEPFTWLTHCMTGGLPRDVKRTARAMIALTEPGGTALSLDEVCAALVGDDLARKAHAFQLACREIGDAPEVTTFIRLLRRLTANGPLLLALLPELKVAGEPAALSGQAAAYVYYSATLLEVFRQDLVEQEPPETFEKLAQAKQSLAVHPRLAWLLVDEFREAWGLPAVPVD